jgi:glutathione S-transferase
VKLYYAPGACSLASHIVLHELGLPFEAEYVSLARKTTRSGVDFQTINPKGYVPALELDGGGLLTEGPAILQYLADRVPAAGLAPPCGTLERARLQEWLSFISSELHKPFGPALDRYAAESEREAARRKIALRLDYTQRALEGRDYLLGPAFTVADAYLYTVLRWTDPAGIDLGRWPGLAAYRERIGARPAVAAARAAERLR